MTGGENRFTISMGLFIFLVSEAPLGSLQPRRGTFSTGYRTTEM